MAKFNTGGAASGAQAGASVGSMFGPWGTAIGAIGGGLYGGFGSGKKKKKLKKLSTLDPTQQGIYEDYARGLRGEGDFADLYNFDADAANQNFDQMYSRPAYRNFQENIIPNITGQFRGKNLMNSSYTGEALSRAGRNVQEGLDAQRANMIYQGSQASMDRKNQAIDRILNMKTFAYMEPEPQSGGMFDQIMKKLGPQAGEWFADYLKSKGG